MKTIFYKKEGRRYVPVSEYDSVMMDAFPKGSHLVQCYPGGSSRRFNVDPNYAAMIAAGRVAEDAIGKVIMSATEIRRQQRRGPEGKGTPLTPGQKKAWDTLVKEFGEDARQLEWPSARECAEEAVKAMQDEADKLMANPTVRKAWDHFQLVCTLVKDVKHDPT